MSDFRNILSKFNELGIENKGLTPDDPTQQRSASTQTPTSSTEADHARLVNESVQGKHIPGITDIRASDVAALAGVKSSTPQPTPQPTPQTAPMINTTSTSHDRWSDVEARLEKIENKINMMFEALVPKEKDANKHQRHTLDLDDLERKIRKSGKMDQDTEDAINARRKKLAKDKMQKLAAGLGETTEHSLKKDFASFLKDLESK